MPQTKKTAKPRNLRSKADQQLIDDLRARLEEAEETLRAIREGDVDAIVVSGKDGDQVFSLVGTESIYRLIVETMKEAAFTVTFDGQILFCNAQFGQYVRRPLEQIVGRPLEEFVAGDDRPAAQALLAASQREPVKQRLVFASADGARLPAHVSANVLHQPDGLSICVVATDLTELENSAELIQKLRLQQEALRESEELNRGTLQALPAHIAVLDADGQIVTINQAWREFARDNGLADHPAVSVGANYVDVCRRSAAANDPDAARALAGIESVLHGRAPTFTMEYPCHSPQEDRWFLMTVVPFGSTRPGAVVAHLNITARMRAELRLKDLAEDLRRSNQDLEQFAYVASHDLQEPLRMVTGFMSRLRQGYSEQLDDKAREYIQYAFDGATRMSSLINDLLEYARVQNKKPAPVPVDMNAAMQKALAACRASIQESGAKVVCEGLPQVVGDPLHLGLLLQNLVGNAIKFRRPHVPPEIRVGFRSEGDRWVFFVQDNGIGIDRQHMGRLFQIFQRLHTRQQYPGTGVGLAICKKIVERHGGTIWIESQPGQGATFFFTIPKAARTPPGVNP